MEAQSQQRKRRNDALPSLNTAINALDLAREMTSLKLAKSALDSARVLLVTTRDSVVNEAEYVDLALACADICQVLERVINGRGMDQPSQPVSKAVDQLTTTIAKIQEHVARRGKRSVLSRTFRAMDNEGAIAAWKLDLEEIRRVFDAELAMDTDISVSQDMGHDALNAYTIIPDLCCDVSGTGVPLEARNNAWDAHTVSSRNHHHVAHPHPFVSGVRDGFTHGHTTASDIRHDKSKNQEGTYSQDRLAAHASAPGESSPNPPRNPSEIIPDIHRGVARAQAIVSEVRRDVIEIHQILKNDGQNQATQSRSADFNPHGIQPPPPETTTPGELPPPPPRACFGRDELIETIVTLAENLTPIALIGAGGIGKTSVALTALHHGRIKERFGENRRFIRCDQFPASRANFLSRLSRVIGAGIKNPEDLVPLRSSLSSKEMFIVLDNAESIIDPHGTDGEEVYRMVEELSRFGNICLVITSRITATPPNCQVLRIPTLSMDAACSTFYRIHKPSGRSDSVDNILKQLDFHPLSVTLLATVAHQHQWGSDRLAREWEQGLTGMLQTEHNESLAAAIEVSLASLMFKKLGPHARELLGVVAFFPQGVDESNLNWLFPTIPGAAVILDKFCILSLTYRNNGFVTMLMPLRDYLRPKDPLSSSLLSATKERYFIRMTTKLNPNAPGFRATRWITSEDANIEHLLNVFTSIDTNSDEIWSACANFLDHLSWHKPRQTVLGPKIEGLPNNHRSKLECLFMLARSFELAGNQAERKRLLNQTLMLSRERGDDRLVASTLGNLADANRMLHLYEEGIHRAKEALEIYERVGDTAKQGDSLLQLALSLDGNRQPDAAAEAASRVIELSLGKGEEFQVCVSHRVLGNIYRSKGERENAVRHLETALGIASSFSWNEQLFWIYFSLAILFRVENKFDDAHAHIERAKSHAIDNPYNLGRAVLLHAQIYYRQRRLEDATSEAKRALEIFDKLGAANDLESCEDLLWHIEQS